MVSVKVILWIKAKKIVDLILDNNRTYDCKVVLLRIMFYNDRLKHQMEINNGKYKENYFSIDSIEKRVKYLQDHVIITVLKRWYNNRH